jgi:3-keto-5-aminohexanoate cleavage enzyme
MAKVMIESAINGIAMKDANPHIGYTPEEIANDAIATCKAGAALIHFHVRKPDGEWCQDVPYYAEVYKRVRSAMGAQAPLLWPTFPGGKDAAVRYSHFVELSRDPATRPDLGAADMGSVNLAVWNADKKSLRGGTYQNSFDTLRDTLKLMRECGLKRPTLQIFDGTFLRTSLIFLEQGLLEEPLLLKYYFGGPEQPFGLPPTVESIQAYNQMLKGVRAHWFASCFGGDALQIAPVAVAMGGHIRLGLEDYQYRHEGKLSNPQIVERAVQIAKSMGHEVATPQDARKMLEI